MVSDFLDSIPENILSRTKELDLSIQSVNAHEAIESILSKTVLRGGKRLRPLLTFLMGNLFKVSLDDLTPFARATECVHAASLSHDDVIDNATQRRGQPSINILASNKKAVLAGDYLLSSVIVDLTNAGNLELVKEMSLVINDLSVGEWLQLDLIESREYRKELILDVAMKKTSSVMSYCCVAPAILSHMPKEIVETSRKLGNHLGLAFQLIDDTLDYSQISNKDQMLDLENNIVNSVVFDHFLTHPHLFERFKGGESLLTIFENVDMQTSVSNITAQAHQHLEMAHSCLVQIKNHLSQKKMESFAMKDLEESFKSMEMVIAFIGMRKS